MILNDMRADSLEIGLIYKYWLEIIHLKPQVSSSVRGACITLSLIELIGKAIKFCLKSWDIFWLSTFRGQKSEMDLPGLKLRSPEGCGLSGGSRGEPIPLPFLASWGHLHSLSQDLLPS